MAAPENVMQVFTLLDKTNCRKCGEKTCLAFAGAVYQGRRRIGECPSLDPHIVARFAPAGSEAGAAGAEDYLEGLKLRLADCDFAEAAARTGGRFSNGRLSLKILGKDFAVDSAGTFYTDIHVISWVVVPFLTYVLDGQGKEVAGEWISFREMSGGRERYPLFKRRCEDGMKRVADVYTDLFADLVQLFEAKQVEALFESDVSVVLQVLPRVPLMICYWKDDEGLASSLNIFFDRTVDVNLGIDAAFSLGTGLTQMFEKLALRHGCIV